MLPRLPPLVALRAFHALALTGSVRAAGEALSVSHTVVSRHVRNLEQALGVKLVSAAGRGLLLTAEGARFQARIAPHLAGLAEAAADLRRRERRLTIRCVPGFANVRVLPRLPELQRLLPERDVVLEPRLSRPRPAGVEVDGEVVYLEHLSVASPLRAERLAVPRVFPVMTPEMRERQPIRHVDDLLRLPMLHDESMDLWRAWLRAVRSQRQPHGSCLGTAQLAIDAARLGQGVALANELLVEDDLRAGRLVEAFPSEVRPKSYHFLADAGRWEEADVTVIRDWFHAMCQPSGAFYAPMGGK
jgi:LysR family glycine cleavage system transcriptional activator